MKNRAAYKERLLKSSLDFLSKKIDEVDKSLKDLQSSANQESRSSMGDKYETGRSMALLEKEKLHSLYENLTSQYKILSQIKPKVSEKVESGTIIFTKGNLFLVSVPLGNIEFEGKKIFLLSPTAPLATAVSGLKEGDPYVFQGKREKIEELY